MLINRLTNRNFVSTFHFESLIQNNVNNVPKNHIVIGLDFSKKVIGRKKANGETINPIIIYPMAAAILSRIKIFNDRRKLKSKFILNNVVFATSEKAGKNAI